MRNLLILTLLFLASFVRGVIGIVVHSPNLLYPQGPESQDAYLARLTTEFKAIKALGFGAVRLHLDAKDLLDSTGSGHGWGVRYYKTCFLAVKANSLNIHLTLPEPTTLAHTMPLHRAVMDASAQIFTPAELSWGIRNEPVEWAAGRRDPLTFDLGVSDIAHWDSAKYNEKGYVLASPSFAGWFFEPDPGLESFYNLRFIWDRFLENRIGLTQRTAVAFSFYIHPDWDLVAARLKANAIKALVRKHLISHKLLCVEAGIRYDLYPSKATEYAQGKKTGQLLKMLEEVFGEVYLFDYNGTSKLSIKGRSRFIAGLQVGLR
jgi:hypothetical protein